MLTHDLVFTSHAFTEMIRRLSSPGHDQERLPCGVSRMPDHWEWLVSGSGEKATDSPAVLVVRGTHPEMLADAVRTTASHEPDGNDVILGVGIGPAAGHFAGMIRSQHKIAELGVVRVIAPGLPRLTLGSPRFDRPSQFASADRVRFSRSIGALGEGAFDRLRSLRIAVVGCGRTGSLVVDHIAAYGVTGLTLIDPDVMERHNLGEMVGELDATLERPKATALAERVLRRGLGTDVTAVTAPVQSLDALFALKHSDVLVSCPDNPVARIATASVAALYLKPVLDLGTGILRARTGRETGLDVRWLLPGRCVSCVGGQRSAMSEPPRLGSLRSLNTWAVGLGFTLLEQFISGVVTDSVWVQGNVEADGVPRSSRVNLTPGWGCRVCAVAGRGDEGLRHLETILHEMRA
jgi:hypothetical protein